MRRAALWVGAVCLAIAGGCQVGPTIGGQNNNGNGSDAGVGGDAGGGGDGQVVNLRDKVYAHSAATLYEVDPNTLQVTTVGAFGWPPSIGFDEMTDIAIDDRGRMTGISFTRLYEVDKATAVCTYLADLQTSNFNGLSYVEGIGVDPTAPTLVAVTQSGDVYAIDELSGASTLLGNYGGGFGSSGDLVFIRGDGAYATAEALGYSSDVLVRLSPQTGVVTPIGETGYQDIWGLAYWGGQLFGFTDGGAFVLIDRATGAATLQQAGANRFWGAGVTTVAPIVR